MSHIRITLLPLLLQAFLLRFGKGLLQLVLCVFLVLHSGIEQLLGILLAHLVGLGLLLLLLLLIRLLLFLLFLLLLLVLFFLFILPVLVFVLALAAALLLLFLQLIEARLAPCMTTPML